MKIKKETVYAYKIDYKNYEQNKLLFVMSPYVKTCSALLKKAAKEKIVFMDNLRKKLEYKGINEKAPLKDET